VPKLGGFFAFLNHKILVPELEGFFKLYKMVPKLGGVFRLYKRVPELGGFLANKILS
jgi:hypothetical protein